MRASAGSGQFSETRENRLEPTIEFSEKENHVKPHGAKSLCAVSPGLANRLRRPARCPRVQPLATTGATRRSTKGNRGAMGKGE